MSRSVRALAALTVSLAATALFASGAGAGTALPPFRSSASSVTAAELGGTWHAGCPVGPASLRLLHVDYYGFDGRPHTGTIVVNAAVTTAVVTVFRTLYTGRFPIRSMIPESAFGGHDPDSMAADNTSGFNCRLAVADGPPTWSVHAYGEAIDVNPVENPYVLNGVPQPAAGSRFLDRADVRPGMAVRGGTLVGAFTAVHWYWGGRWTSAPDYQHFSATGG